LPDIFWPEEDLYTLEVTGAELLAILETGMQDRRRDKKIMLMPLMNCNLPHQLFGR